MWMKGSLEKGKCGWCASRCPKRREIIYKKNTFHPHVFSAVLKMSYGLHTETLQRNLAHGKGADDASDRRQGDRGATEVPATIQAAHVRGKQKLSSWRRTKSCHPGVLAALAARLFSWGKKYVMLQGCVYHYPGVFPSINWRHC